MSDDSLAAGELMEKGEKLISLTDTYVEDIPCITEFVQMPSGGYVIYHCPLEGEYEGERFYADGYASPDTARKVWNKMVDDEEAVSPDGVFKGVEA